MGLCDLFERPVLFRVIAFAMGPYYECPCVSETTVNDLFRIYHFQTKTSITTRQQRVYFGEYCSYLSNPMIVTSDKVQHLAVAWHTSYRRIICRIWLYVRIILNIEHV